MSTQPARMRGIAAVVAGALVMGGAGSVAVAHAALSFASWQLANPAAAFRPRDCAGPLVFEGKMWLLGGWDPHEIPTTNSEVWSSSDGVDWTLVAVAPWEGRHCAGYAVFQGKMWIIGGDNNQYHYQNDVWSSPDGVTWTQVAADVPWRDRVTHYVLAHDGRLWVLGGQQIEYFDPGGTAVYDDVWSSTDGADWTLVTAHAPWAPRGQILGAAVFDGKMWVIGGGTYNDPRKYYRDVWSSTDGVSWDRVSAAAPWKARQYHNVTVFEDELWVLGGHNDDNLGDVWHSPDGITWKEIPDTPWAQRHAGSVFVFDQALWMIAGTAGGLGGVTTNEVWKLTRSYAPACAPAPIASCTEPTVPRSSRLRLDDRENDAGDRITWRSTRGPATRLDDYGDPLRTTGYALCVYDAAAQLIVETGALPSCVGTNCWASTRGSRSWKVVEEGYDGSMQAELGAGLERKVRISFAAGGEHLGPPPLGSLALPLTVQLQPSEGGGCWGARFSSGRASGGGPGAIRVFTARSD